MVSRALQATVRPVDYAGEPFLMYDCQWQPTNEIRICGTVRTSYQPHGEIEVLELPAAELAYTIDHGSYTTIHATLERLPREILGLGLSIAGDAREILSRHPANSGGVEAYRTELAIPVLRPAKIRQ